MPKKIDENQLKQFADSVEGGQQRVANVPTFDLPIADDRQPAQPIVEQQTQQQTAEDRLRAQRPEKKTLEEAQAERREEVLKAININGLGYLPIAVTDLPSKGAFYPLGTKLYIRAATGGEIRHWSQVNEQEFTDINESLNYILDRCLSVKMEGRIADYKDIIDIDRMFLIFAIRDFTFPDGNNELMVKIDENNQIPLKKDNIDFIKFEDNIMRYYNAEKRCFTIQNIKPKNGGDEIILRKPLNIYLPKVGVTKWLTAYVQRKTQSQELFDRDFVTMAPILIPDYRGLTDETYANFVASCDYFGVYEYSVIEQFKRVITASAAPRFKYLDSEGVEQTAPLTFQGGFKALFLWGRMGDII